MVSVHNDVIFISLAMRIEAVRQLLLASWFDCAVSIHTATYHSSYLHDLCRDKLYTKSCSSVQ